MATTRILEGLGRLYIWLLLAFLYLPIIIMALMSFNVSPFYQLPFEWTTEWYAALWQNDQLIAATWNSIEIAVITTLICTVLGSAASLKLTWPLCASASRSARRTSMPVSKARCNVQETRLNARVFSARPRTGNRTSARWIGAHHSAPRRAV